MAFRKSILRIAQVSVCLLLGLGGASAQTLADWVKIQPAEVKGCQSIPYDSARDECIDLARDVDLACKSASNPFSCSSLGTRNLLTTITAIEAEIDRLQSGQKAEARVRDDRAASDNLRAEAGRKVQTLEGKITNAIGRLNANKKQLDTNRSQAQAYLANGEKCRGLREDVQKLFEQQVIQRARSETDPAIRAIAAAKISLHWGPEYASHIKHIEIFVTPAIDRCRACVNGVE